ncbi:MULTISPECIES: ArsR/SmtB family transcription factor [Flammeovirga]|uniref:ArsR family transcriptional regulator n=2 Tax=Flammeovirga TaxID=59739 RepID=A0A3Q9FTM3_9BACT|nr:MULTISPECIES: metalloregulator ArsR/SmtB family transcription factor [Flammeovirga]AZQ64353.1 ArsR family transcriptional regulator [Flammeovirga pectinis]MBB6462770.1 DNA-binding transcriptional ArsR family regulator [Flammeovirga kamogawensis]QWG06001.1 metalloregulator ArsR/SmtB family transcription factor [Flammeovirga kamogawensis]TRX67830.1 metalloregulator ArsR/SmtB family transcription factor [Flammeovirga kamogawensis]
MKLKHFNLSIGTQIMKALGEESRIRIINLLHTNEEMCISDIELVLDYTQTKTSRHLIYMKNAGLLNVRKIDQWSFYSIKEEISGIVETIFKYMERDVQLIEDQETYNTLSSNRELAMNKIERRRMSHYPEGD